MVGVVRRGVESVDGDVNRTERDAGEYRDEAWAGLDQCAFVVRVQCFRVGSADRKLVVLDVDDSFCTYSAELLWP